VGATAPAADGDGLSRRRRESPGWLVLVLALARLRVDLEPVAGELADRMLGGPDRADRSHRAGREGGAA
jgi:hypothetical protein